MVSAMCIMKQVQHYSTVATVTKGGGSIFFGGQAKNIMETNGALACRENSINYIHDYDVIIIGHKRSSKVTGMLSLPTSG